MNWEDFFNKLPKKFRRAYADWAVMDKAQKEGLVEFKEYCDGNLYWIRTTDKFKELKKEQEDMQKKLMSDIRNTTSEREKKSKMAKWDKLDDELFELEQMETPTSMFVSTHGTRKIMELIREVLIFEDTDEVRGYFLAKKVENYSIAFKKPWWYDIQLGDR